ncbi:hypothetical protein CDAR_172251 [Caerostris darwini]|uniref:Uncharacterized protein n=1 Tax=Caerostris darwini TaxID=1538125 RepID=A0AAV4U3H5_9ARAC|nr:hypothetical protein CDAR_172251 [Caerostris darwini]
MVKKLSLQKRLQWHSPSKQCSDNSMRGGGTKSWLVSCEPFHSKCTNTLSWTESISSETESLGRAEKHHGRLQCHSLHQGKAATTPCVESEPNPGLFPASNDSCNMCKHSLTDRINKQRDSIIGKKHHGRVFGSHF